MLISDVPAFCSSFIDAKATAANADEVQSPGLSQSSRMQVDEISAFQLEDEETKQAEPAVELQKQRLALIETRARIAAQLQPLAIDLQAVKFYFKQLRNIPDQTEEGYMENVEVLLDVIDDLTTASEEERSRLMCARGLLLLMHNEQFSDYQAAPVTQKILSSLQYVLKQAVPEGARTEMDLSKQHMVIRFIASMSKELLHEFVMHL